jgi:hypothetical protein
VGLGLQRWLCRQIMGQLQGRRVVKLLMTAITSFHRRSWLARLVGHSLQDTMVPCWAIFMGVYGPGFLSVAWTLTRATAWGLNAARGVSPHAHRRFALSCVRAQHSQPCAVTLQRFHGAFTGGFSAGYFNTVGSKVCVERLSCAWVHRPSWAFLTDATALGLGGCSRHPDRRTSPQIGAITCHPAVPR